MATSKEEVSAAEMHAELRFLRQRNNDLQSLVEKLLKLQKEYGEDAMGSASSSSPNVGHKDNKREEIKEKPIKSHRSDSITSQDESSHGRLHHRRIDRPSLASSSASIRHLSVKSKVPDQRVMSRADSHFGLITSPASRSSAGASPANGRMKDGIAMGRLKRKLSDKPNGHIIQALSMDCDDEEEGQIRDLHVDISQDSNNDDVSDEELDDLIDDDSHNKHVPKIASRSTRSNSKSSLTLADFPPFKDQLRERAGWLIGLLVFQSCSSFIIQYNERFLQ